MRRVERSVDLTRAVSLSPDSSKTLIALFLTVHARLFPGHRPRCSTQAGASPSGLSVNTNGAQTHAQGDFVVPPVAAKICSARVDASAQRPKGLRKMQRSATDELLWNSY